MASTFYAVFDEQSAGTDDATGRTAGKEGKVLEPLKTAKVVKLEAENVADAQLAVQSLFKGDAETTPAIIAEAQFKTS